MSVTRQAGPPNIADSGAEPAVGVIGRVPAAPGESTAKSLRRALRLLRAVATRELKGTRLTDLAAGTGLHAATAHRLLTALQQEGMVSFDPDTKLYKLGLEILMMGETSRRLAVRQYMRPALERIALDLEDDAYLVVPADTDGVLIDKVDGTLPFRLASPGIGSRRPLGIGAAAIGLLAAYPLERARRIFEQNRRRYQSVKWTTPDDVWHEVLQTPKRGYTVVRGHMVDEATAVAVAFLDQAGEPVAAIGVSATNSRMMPERRAEIAALIKAEVAALGAFQDSRLVAAGESSRPAERVTVG